MSIPLNKERFAILVLHFNPLATKTKSPLFLFWSKQTTTDHDFQLAATGADETIPLIFQRKLHHQKQIQELKYKRSPWVRNTAVT